MGFSKIYTPLFDSYSGRSYACYIHGVAILLSELLTVWLIGTTVRGSNPNRTLTLTVRGSNPRFEASTDVKPKPKPNLSSNRLPQFDWTGVSRDSL